MNQRDTDTSDTDNHAHTRTSTHVINYSFAFILLLFLALILIAAIRHQKYQIYLQTLNTHSTATYLHPQILAKSKLIMDAFNRQDYEALQLLVDAKDEQEKTLLRKALYDYSLAARPHLTDHILSRQCTRSLQILLETHAIDPNHLHLLHTVISDMKGHDKHRQFMEILLDHGADPDLPNRKGYPPIAHAIIHTNLEALEILLAHHAQINRSFHSHDSFLHFAVLSFLDPSLEIVSMLLRNGANPFHRGSDGLTPFHHAIRKHPGNLGLIRVFLNTTPHNVNTESYRLALLHYPSASRNVIQPTEYTRYGYSPLHWAVASYKPALVRFLLNHGANPSQPDSDNITPRQLALRLKNRQIIAMFR